MNSPKYRKDLSTIGLNAIPALVERATSSTDAAARASAVKALAAIALSFPEQVLPPNAFNALESALEDPDRTVQLATVSALSTLGQPAFDILISALETEDIALRVSVISALGSLGDRRGIEILTAIAADDTADPYLCESATNALSRLEQILEFKGI